MKYWPGPDTLEEYLQAPSTKLEVAVKLLKHHMGTVCALPLTNVHKNGHLIHPGDEEYLTYTNDLVEDASLLDLPSSASGPPAAPATEPAAPAAPAAPAESAEPTQSIEPTQLVGIPLGSAEPAAPATPAAPLAAAAPPISTAVPSSSAAAAVAAVIPQPPSAGVPDKAVLYCQFTGAFDFIQKVSSSSY